MKITEERLGKTSIVIASWLPVGSWYDVIGEETGAMQFWTGQHMFVSN